jgi:hypothetical protein
MNNVNNMIKTKDLTKGFTIINSIYPTNFMDFSLVFGIHKRIKLKNDLIKNSNIDIKNPPNNEI